MPVETPAPRWPTSHFEDANENNKDPVQATAYFCTNSRDHFSLLTLTFATRVTAYIDM